MANAADLRRKAAEIQRQALTLVNLAADEDRELSEDEQATLTNLIGPADGDALGGETGRCLKQAAILDRIEANLTNAKAPAPRVTAPVPAAGQDSAPGLGGVKERLAKRYNAASED